MARESLISYPTEVIQACAHMSDFAHDLPKQVVSGIFIVPLARSDPIDNFRSKRLFLFRRGIRGQPAAVGIKLGGLQMLLAQPHP